MGLVQQQAISAEVHALFECRNTTELPYHNLDHTLRVVSWAWFLGMLEHLNADELELLQMAAWMHDVGYLFDYRNHEHRGALFATEWMTKIGYPSTQVELVANAILSTQLNKQPGNLIEQILNDADFAHFGSIGFPELSWQLKDEIGRNTQAEIGCKEWLQQTINLMESHRYHTRSARKSLVLEKEKNLIHLRANLSLSPDNFAI